MFPTMYTHDIDDVTHGVIFSKNMCYPRPIAHVPHAIEMLPTTYICTRPCNISAKWEYSVGNILYVVGNILYGVWVPRGVHMSWVTSSMSWGMLRG